MTSPLPSPAPSGSPRPRLVVATRNPGKLQEFRRLLRGHAWRVVSLDDVGFADEIDEPGPGYAENATAKAVTVCAATGLCALGDDSGIEVRALRDWPGPASARWLGAQASDADRLHGLRAEAAAAGADPRVRYVAVLCLARPAAEPILAHGSCEGILVEPRGTAGFGYDPGFLSDDLGVTLGEASVEDKDRISHRARALARLAESGVLDPPPGTG